MQNKLRNYIEGLFENAPSNRKTVELKEEMLENMEEKYADLIGEGKSPEAAFNIVVAGIGDVGALLKQLQDEPLSETQLATQQQYKQKSALRIAAAVMLFILSVLPLVIFTELELDFADVVGVPILFITVAIGVGLLIYNSMVKPQFIKDKEESDEDESIIDEFLEFKEESREHKKMRGALSTALWSLITVIYFIVSFATMAWHLTWLIFIVGCGIEALLTLFLSIAHNRRKK